MLARLGTVSRGYQRFPQNNYSGHNGSLGLEWRVTPRTQVSATLRHDVEPAQDFVSNYVAVKGLRVGAVWEYSPKLRVDSRLEWRDAQSIWNAYPTNFTSSSGSASSTCRLVADETRCGITNTEP